jgi:DNA primase
MQNVIEEIKSRIDIVDLISEYVELKPVGANYRALCPFHKEKKPSFYVSPEKQIWHCFGACNEGGDIFKFLMKIENIDFSEALRILAKKANIEIDKKDYHFMSQKTKLLDILNLASKFYHLILLKSSLAKEAREYLENRKLKIETIKEFQLGFAPDRKDELYKFLTKRGFKENDIELAGLILFKEEGNKKEYHDRFRNRIMFPINDLYGNTVGFTARIVPWAEKEDIPKYINTPETPVYIKSRILYGLDKAKNYIKEKNFTIIVEGNMDVISCHQAGWKNVVASSGTALTLEQIKILKRYTNNLYLAFDVDLAGEAATKRGIDNALSEEMNVKVIIIPNGKDPDECIKESVEIWEKAVNEAKPVMDYFFDLAFKDKDPSKIEDKKEIVKLLLPVIVKLGDQIERDWWIKNLANRLNVSESLLLDKLKSFLKKNLSKFQKTEVEEEIVYKESKEELFLGLLLKYPDLVINYFLNLPIEAFNNKKREAAEILREFFEINKNLDFNSLKSKIKKSELIDYLGYLCLLVEKKFLNFPLNLKNFKEEDKENLKFEIEGLFKNLKKNYLKKKRAELINSLKEAEKEGNQTKVKDLIIQINNLNEEIKSF